MQRTPQELQALWVEYKDSGEQSLRNELVVHYGSLVKYVVYKLSLAMPATVDREDLNSFGQFGLIDAIERFDLSKNVKFETYAITRIRGSIFDELRIQDWVPRSVRTKAKDILTASSRLEEALGRKATDDELAIAMGLTIEDLWIAQSQASVTQVTTLDADLTRIIRACAPTRGSPTRRPTRRTSTT